ncbi:MAG: hypothetical protein PHW69_09975, partial [Elusimicrobiaceae bacterium]|nr:hypothetical protein [Elusimicrobiaceae bacterium]
MPLKIDLHIHSFRSRDCETSCEEIARTAAGAGLAFYALTDHAALPGPECFPENSARPAITAKTDTAIPPGPALPPAPRAIAGVEVSTSAGHIIG